MAKLAIGDIGIISAYYGDVEIIRAYKGDSLVWTNGPQTAPLRAGHGRFTGYNANAYRLLVAETSNYRFTSYPMFAGYKKALDKGGFVIHGYTLDDSKQMHAAVATYHFRGYPADLARPSYPPLAKGGFNLTGYPVKFGDQSLVTYVIIPSGVVSEDLTDFVSYVNLSNMPPVFWTKVKEDGGDIRLYKEDGVTQVPFDLIQINTTAQTGELYFKADLAAATDNIFILESGVASRSGLAVTDTYGRNATWSDYHRVFMFPSLADRTGLGTDAVTVNTTTFDSDGWLSLAGSGFAKATGVTKFTSWTMGASAKPTSISGNRSVIGYTQAESSSSIYRENLLIRAGNISTWNNYDNWLSDSRAISTGELCRLALTHDTTVSRKLYADGVETIDSVVTQMPGGLGDGLSIGSSYTAGSGTELFAGSINQCYLRNGILSAAWLAAEDLNWRTPSYFLRLSSLLPADELAAVSIVNQYSVIRFGSMFSQVSAMNSYMATRVKADGGNVSLFNLYAIVRAK